MSNCNSPRQQAGILPRGSQRVLYVTGPLGPQGQRGLQGERGPTGPAGPTGPTGPEPFSAYGTFFNNSPATVPPCRTVPLPFTMMCTLPREMCLVNNRIMLCETGVYMVDYTIYTQPNTTNSFGLYLSDNLVIGSATENSNINHANTLITTNIPQQLVRVVNIGENDAILSTPKCSISNVIVTIIKIY